MNYYQLYVKTDCPFCKKALDKLEELDKMAVVTVLDRAPPELVETIKAQFQHRTVPIVLEVDPARGLRKIGGCDDLMAELNVQDAEIETDSKKVPIRLEDMSEEERQADEDYWHNHGQGD